LNVDGFGDGTNFDIWGTDIGAGEVIAPGNSAIFVQTTQYNFDSSDDQGAGSSSAIPVVHLTVDGVSSDLADTAQVLNTEGTDHLGANNENESHQWRDIGTFGGQSGVPEPSSVIALSGLGVMGVLGYVRRRRNAA
jgi:hypothetical protein